jgi:hypothetical protein
MQQLRTVCYLLDNDEILLAEIVYSSRARVVAGIGGEVTSEKTLEHQTIQYLYHDVRVTVYPHDLKKVGVLHHISENEKGERVSESTLHIFTCEKWQGEIQNTPGIKPSWYTQATLPYSSMLEQEEQWLPLIMQGEKVLIEILEKKDDVSGEFILANISVREIFSTL